MQTQKKCKQYQNFPENVGPLETKSGGAYVGEKGGVMCEDWPEFEDSLKVAASF